MRRPLMHCDAFDEESSADSSGEKFRDWGNIKMKSSQKLAMDHRTKKMINLAWYAQHIVSVDKKVVEPVIFTSIIKLK